MTDNARDGLVDLRHGVMPLADQLEKIIGQADVMLAHVIGEVVTPEPIVVGRLASAAARATRARGRSAAPA